MPCNNDQEHTFLKISKSDVLYSEPFLAIYMAGVVYFSMHTQIYIYIQIQYVLFIKVHSGRYHQRLRTKIHRRTPLSYHPKQSIKYFGILCHSDYFLELNHWCRVTDICVSKLAIIVSGNGHYLNQCCDIVNWARQNKLQWNLEWIHTF